MSVKVCKFGGSSLADASQFQKVRSIIEADDDRRYIVVSAPGRRSKEDHKVTDLLYLCHAAASEKVSFNDTWQMITARFNQIIRDLDLSLDLSGDLAEIQGKIAAGASADYAASRGEYLNGRIMAALLDVAFIDPAEVILFNERGRFDPEQTQARMAARLSDCTHAVVPGFYGAMADGRIRTFSRGGSDVTGAIVARGASATVYENWTDVSGMLMADPRIVKNPRPIQTITYRELRELAYMGATVLHDEAIFPVREAGIPVNVRNTNAPDDPGTMIIRECESTPRDPDSLPITGVAGRCGFSVIHIEKALMNAQMGFGRRVLSVLENHHVNFEHIPSGIDTLSIVVESLELEDKLDGLLSELNSTVKPDALTVENNLALIATVGRGMKHTPGMAARLFAAIGQAQINIRMIDQGSSELNIIIGVDEKDFHAAVSAIYMAFIGK